MNITVREIKPEEIKEVHSMARKAFNGFESIWVPKPEKALVAVSDDQILGGMVYQIIKSGDKKVGYIDHIFIDSDYKGKGIGTVLYEQSTKFLWGLGCSALAALVKDDNVGSWHLFLKNDFKRTSFGDAAKVFGSFSMLKQYFAIPFFAGVGMDYYLALPSQEEAESTPNNFKEILAFILVNLLIAVPALLTVNDMARFFTAYTIVLSATVIFGYLGTLLTKEKWKFRFTNGGALITLIFNFMTIFPMVGNWYPMQYKKSPEFKRDMGISAFVPWVFLIIMASFRFLGGTGLIKNIAQISSMVILYRCIPVFPFESFGGKRVFKWNKPVFCILAVLSAVIYLWPYK